MHGAVLRILILKGWEGSLAEGLFAGVALTLRPTVDGGNLVPPHAMQPSTLLLTAFLGSYNWCKISPIYRSLALCFA